MILKSIYPLNFYEKTLDTNPNSCKQLRKDDVILRKYRPEQMELSIISKILHSEEVSLSIVSKFCIKTTHHS